MVAPRWHLGIMPDRETFLRGREIFLRGRENFANGREIFGFSVKHCWKELVRHMVLPLVLLKLKK